MSAEYEVARRCRRHHAEQPAGQRPGLRHAPRHRRRPRARAAPTPAVKAIVITGAGKAFSGGADITRVRHAQGARRAEPADA